MNRIALLILIFLWSCSNDKDPALCTDNLQNGNETGIDCGGSCPDCPTCFDGVQNGFEEGVDCGGDCPNSCDCFNGILDEEEICIDCGGACPECEVTGRYAEVIFPAYVDMEADEVLFEAQEIVYGSNTFVSGIEKDLTVDYFEPAGDSESKRPIILAMGGFTLQQPSINAQFTEGYPYVQHFLSRGFVIALVNTRFDDTNIDLTETTLLDALIKARADLLSAIRFFRGQAATYQIDPDQIWLMGYSGGAFTCLHAAFLNETDAGDIGDDLLTAIENNGGFEGDSGNDGVSNHVRGVINLSGWVLDEGFVDANEPSLFSIIGANDAIHPLGCAPGTDAFGNTMDLTFCGPGIISQQVSDSKLKVIEMLPANAIAPLDQSQCPECIDEITQFMAARIDCNLAQN